MARVIDEPLLYPQGNHHHNVFVPILVCWERTHGVDRNDLPHFEFRDHMQRSRETPLPKSTLLTSEAAPDELSYIIVHFVPFVSAKTQEIQRTLHSEMSNDRVMCGRDIRYQVSAAWHNNMINNQQSHYFIQEYVR